MTELGSFEAKNKFSELLNRAEHGEEVVITRRGKPVAKLGPFQFEVDLREAKEAAARLRDGRNPRSAAVSTGRNGRSTATKVAREPSPRSRQREILMIEVGSFEAKKKFSALLDRAERGEAIVIQARQARRQAGTVPERSRNGAGAAGG